MNTFQELVQSLLHDTEQLLQNTTLKERSKTLIHAAKVNDIDLATKILPYSDAMFDSCEALEWAVFNQNLHMVELLIPHLDLKNPDNRCLMMAFNLKNDDVIDLLYPLADVNITLQKLIEDPRVDHEAVANIKRRMTADKERALLSEELLGKGYHNTKKKM